MSGEMLVDTCGNCEHPLGWRSTWGIGVCEACEETVSSSNEADLPAMLKEHYLRFSELWALEEDRRHRARKLLPVELENADFTSLLPLSIKLSAMFHFGSTENTTIESIKAQPAPILAKIVSSSYGLLSAWPISFKNQLNNLVEDFDDDHDQFIQVWNWLKKAANPTLSGLGQSDLLLSAMPDLSGSVWHAFKQEKRTYTSQESLLKLGTQSLRLRKLASEKVVPTKKLPSLTRGNCQYDAEAIDELEKMKRDSITFAGASQQLEIPVYGVEQLFSCGIITGCESVGMSILFDDIRLSASGLRRTIAMIVDQCQSTCPPQNAVRLKDCSMIFAGREKPWGPICEGLIDGSIPFWGCGQGYKLRDVFVERNALHHLKEQALLQNSRRLNRQAWVTKQDAEDLLNTSFKGVNAAIKENYLEFYRKGTGLAQDKRVVLELAQKIASVRELSYVLEIPPKKLSHHCAVIGLKKLGFGYCRASLIERKVLPAFSNYQ
jgi:hypothetical protein